MPAAERFVAVATMAMPPPVPIGAASLEPVLATVVVSPVDVSVEVVPPVVSAPVEDVDVGVDVVVLVEVEVDDVDTPGAVDVALASTAAAS